MPQPTTSLHMTPSNPNLHDTNLVSFPFETENKEDDDNNETKTISEEESKALTSQDLSGMAVHKEEETPPHHRPTKSLTSIVYQQHWENLNSPPRTKNNNKTFNGSASNASVVSSDSTHSKWNKHHRTSIFAASTVHSERALVRVVFFLLCRTERGERSEREVKGRG
jgi:hypothetical protein